MRIISFAMTTDAVRACRKGVTRRTWADPYFDSFVRALDTAKAKGHTGLLCQGYSASPHRKGKAIATINVTSITRERTRDIPDNDWELEGFAYMAKHGLNVGKNLTCEQLWRAWRQNAELVTAVVRFEIASVVEPIMGTAPNPNIFPALTCATYAQAAAALRGDTA